MSRAAGSSGRRSVDRRGRPPSRAIAAILVIAIVAIIVGYVVLSAANKPLELADLQADPAFALRIPGADELAEVGAERRVTLDGAQSPFAGHIFGTAASSAEVYAFYERELARLGWRPETPPFSRSTAELENRLYCTRKATFRLAIKDKDRAFQPAFYRGRVYLTVFDARLIGEALSSTCPSPRLSSPTLIP